jgi:hypothetical protein
MDKKKYKKREVFLLIKSLKKKRKFRKKGEEIHLKLKTKNKLK